LKLTAPRNPNYAATVVELKDFVDLPNCKHALIFGNAVIVGKESSAGDVGLFFPVEAALSPEFLANNNLYRKNAQTTLSSNIDPEKSGFFEAHGRIKAIKFRGHKSEGFFIPISSLGYLRDEVAGLWAQAVCMIDAGVTFDKIGDHEICHKYVPKGNPGGTVNTQRSRVARLEDQIVEEQFRFHFDTENLRRNLFKIQPNDYISITDKWHGTSVVISRVLTKRKMNWFQRIIKRLGVPVVEERYGLVYSSRRVIKSVNGESKDGRSYYTSDVWGAAARQADPKLPDGFTIYGEIVGYTPDGAEIQKGYTYGCAPFEHKLLVYRVTVTTVNGSVVELPWPQMAKWCEEHFFESVKPLYYGKAGDFGSDETQYLAGLPDVRDWQESFLKDVEAKWVKDQPCPYNGNKVPAEGVVVRIDHLREAENYKLKNFAFLERESKALDKGEVDTETAEAEEVAA
jgi:hypothetical protein